MSTVFEFSKELKSRLTDNGKQWDQALFDACTEAKASEVKATEFCQVLRTTGFRCGTGIARAAYKAVREGADVYEMGSAIETVRAKRKGKPDKDKDQDQDQDKDKDKDKDTDLVEMLEKTLTAARNGHFEIVRMRLVKVQALLAAAELAVARETSKKTTVKTVKVA